MQVVARVFKGHRIQIGGSVFDVLGSRQIRGNYFYILRAQSGEKRSIRRADVIEGQKSGEVRVTA